MILFHHNKTSNIYKHIHINELYMSLIKHKEKQSSFRTNWIEVKLENILKYYTIYAAMLY